tara:strand:+ start:5605 stop:6261 length:657 start_codon:yes stop_codon:yes gene_type:complete
MRIDSKLCHLADNKAVVKVIGWIDEKKVGSALAEATSVELAEDKAIIRLTKRLGKLINTDERNKSNEIQQINKKITVELENKHSADNKEIVQEPIDWSDDLAAIDLEIKRLNWSRVDEVNFLKKELGYNNRNKITNYKELINYLNILKKTNNHNPSNVSNSHIKSLINESENLLKELSWDYKKGREYLQKEFNVSTRKELNEKQLISFVDKLKSQKTK